MNNVILCAKNISKIYKERNEEIEVLKDLNLEVYEGEIVIIFGPSGSGKTTLIHILGGIDAPTLGDVFIDGINLFSHNDNELSKLRNEKISFVFQFHQLLPELTVKENVLLPAMINNKKIDEGKAIMLIKEVGLSGKENRLPSELSCGERQRVAIARALINEPKIILADEPTGNLDSDTSEIIHKLFLDIQKKFCATFIITTHKEALFKIGNRVFKLENKKLQEVL